ncbi:50S ribosomal protein L32 [Candidatus Berkelbacteria bacterium]|nr:50S ribosomal protein L32 [Candidatus Berkelbacteria bacterium]
MAEPKKKRSKTRSRRARHNKNTNPIGLVNCEKCAAQILPHQVCPHCGNYKGKTL